MIDIHCHILPGIDGDGPQDMDTAIQMARIAAEDGVRVIVATPHTHTEIRQPPPDVVREATAHFNQALRSAGIGLEVLPGAETVLTPDLPELVDAGEAMTVGDLGRHVLVELPFNGYPAFTTELFFRLQIAGVVPILAHPERTSVARSDLGLIRSLVEKGALLQINLASLLGREGYVVRRLTWKLLREGLVHSIASDGHNLRDRPVGLSRARKALKRLGGDQAFKMLTETNPGRLIG